MSEIKKINVSAILSGESSNTNSGGYAAISNYNNIEEIDFSNIDSSDNQFNDSKVNMLYPIFASICSGTICKIPGLDTTYVPQGVCDVGEFTLITAYDSRTKDQGRENSVIYVINKNTNEVKTVYLEGTYHCGGIAYDEKTGSVYITGAGARGDNGERCYVNRYNVNDILNGSEEVLATNKIKVDDNNSLKSSTNDKSSAAYLTIVDGNLYVGNFANKDDKGVIKKYDLDSNGVVDANSEQVINNPYDNTQGLCVYTYGDEDYYVFSSSYGRNKDSVVNVAKMDDNGNFQTVNTIEFPCMAEQVNVTSDGELMILFESCAKEYASSAKTSIDDVCVMDFEKLLNS